MIGQLKRRTLHDLRGPGADAEEVRVGDDAEGLVVSDDASGVVPLALLVAGGGRREEGLGDGEGGLEDVGLLLRESHADLGPVFLVLPTRSAHGCYDEREREIERSNVGGSRVFKRISGSL